ncbi:hypothetical protein HYDPIDRAFT_27532 [Hydnomerulius pinastri MD-312]|nr:hypothetical protein HYDPIDRAFT_27532 [Hydnomerulius pinastri MD-312]
MAKEPFDNIDADVILRSSDNVDFRVFKIMLSLTSSFFKTMFGLPQPPDEPSSSAPPGSLPIVTVSENGATLSALLQLCYPAPDPTFHSFEEVSAVVEATIKYDMGLARERAKDLMTRQYLESNALAIYALACRHGFENLAQRAAAETLRINNLGRPSQYVKQMETITAAAYHRLLSYHLACGTAAKAVGEDLSWAIDFRLYRCLPGCRREFPDHPAYKEYLARCGEELLRRPSVSTLLSEESATFMQALLFTGDTANCQSFVIKHLHSFRRLYAAQVQKAISVVQLEFIDTS